MRTLLVSSAILAVATAGSMAVSPSGFAAQAGQVAQREPTAFALQTSGYGTRVRGGEVPAGSSTTAHQVISCTNKAGIGHPNHVLEETIPGVGTVSEVKTVTATKKANGVVSSRTVSTVGSVEISDSALGSVSVDAIKSVSRAFHDDSGFHSTTITNIGSITFTPAVGEPQDIPIPTPDQPAEIPGLATIASGATAEHAGNDGARARADALIIDVTASGSRVRVAHSEAHIERGVRSGIFSGFSAASRATGLQDNVSSGRNPFLPMPCQGTGGEVRDRALGSVDLGGQAVIDGLTSRDMGKQNDKRAVGFARGQVASFNLGDGELVVNGVVGRVHVEREGDKLVRNTQGTQIGTITANGEEQTFPDSDVLEIPGVARLERHVVDKMPSGIEVVALRVTLLDGSGGVIDLGMAKLRIKKSGL